MLYAIREKFSKLSVKIGILFSKLRLTPNQWTLLTLVPTIAALYFLVKENFLLAALLFLVAAFIDIIDGSVARVTGQVTKFGAYLDTIVDRYVEGIIVVGLLFVSLPTLLLPAYVWLFAYFFGSMMTTYAKAAAKEKELVENELRGGLLERAERLALLFVGLALAYFSKTYLVYIIILVALLSNISALQRIYYAAKAGRKK